MRERFRRLLRGHVNIGPLTIYGDNAMHWAWQLSTRRGYLCARPPTRGRGWYVYLSPNATPWAARWGFGPGIDAGDKAAMAARRAGACHCADSNFPEMCPVHFIVHAESLEAVQ